MSTAAVNIDEKCAPDGPVLTELNRSMDGLPVPFLVNRPIIEAYWEVLERTQDKSGSVYWLLTARLAELTILCAGQYADCGEFHLARDLLYGRSEHTAGIFPFLVNLLESTAVVSRAYVGDLHRRWADVVRVLKLLSRWRVDAAEDFWMKYADAPSDERYRIKSSLCFFDRGVFLEMGADVARMLQDSIYRSHFLR